MQRRQFIQTTALSAGLLSLSPKDLLAAIFQQPAFKITMLSKDIGIFTERGGTIAFMLSKSGIVVVDSQFPDQSKHLIDELKKKTENPFKLLINTHHHGDHSAGNISFKGMVEHVLAHANSKTNQENVAKQQKSEDKQLYPDRTYTDTWCEKMDREQICLYYYGAAHTNGDSVVHFTNDDIAHMGDLVANRRHPFVDRTAGASMKNWIDVLDKTLRKLNKKTTYVFGHAGEGFNVSGTADDVKLFRDYIGNVLKLVEDSIKAGKSKEEILKLTEIPGSPEWKPDGITRPLAAAYDEFTTK
jgi:cyclase